MKFNKYLKNSILAIALAIQTCNPAFAEKFAGGKLVETVSSFAASGGSALLDANSATQQIVTGSSTETIALPDATTLRVGMSFKITSKDTAVVTVTDYSAGNLAILNAGESADFVLTDNSVAAGTWAARKSASHPSSSTDNAVVRFNGTQGVLQDSGVIVDDSNNVTGIVDLDASGSVVGSTVRARESMVLDEIAATPSNPQSGKKKLYAKDDGKVYTLDSSGNEAQVGSGAGGAGIQFLSGDDFNLETAVGNWTAYADAAGTSPVDGTGGTPTVTCTRTTSSPLNGTGSLLITKDAANRQGEGCSIAVTVPAGYEGQNISVQFPFKVQSGTYTAGDLSVWLYDVTNSTLISPSGGVDAGLINTSSGIAKAVFGTSTSSTAYRLILHIGSTSASAWTESADDFQVGPNDVVFGVPATDATDYTLTIGAVTSSPTEGSGATKKASWSRIGEKMHIHFEYGQTMAGTAGSGVYLFPLPSGYTIDSSKVVISTNPVGSTPLGSAYAYGTTTPYTGYVWAYDSTHLALFVGNALNNPTSISNTFVGLDVATINYGFEAEFPVVNWSSNVTMANSSGFWISNILANGTRVTSTPTKLGEYRSFQKTISATSGTDAAPATSPSSTNGMKLTTVAYGSAGASGEQRYEIFVGKDKKIQWNFFANTGKSGFLDATYVSTSSSTVLGALKGYDPITGIAWVDVMTQTGSTTTRLIGYTGLESGSAPSTPTTGYFDAFISENALAVGVEAPNSEVKLTYASGTGLAFGTLPNKVFYFPTTTTNTGTAFTVTNSAVNGSSITVNESGIYDIQFMYYGSGASNYIGITIDANTTQQNTSLATTDVTTSYVLDVRYDNLTTTEVVPRGVIRLNPGSVIRAQGSTSAGSDYGYLRVVKVSD